MSFEQPIIYQILLTKKSPQTIAYLKKNQCQSLNTLQTCATSAKSPQTTGTADQTAVDTCSLVASAISLEKLSQEVAKVKETTDQSVCIRRAVFQLL